MTKELIERIKAELTPISQYQLEKQFRDMLDGDGAINICGYEYCLSDALRSVDPIAYREEFLGYIDSLLESDIVEIDDEYYSAVEVTELEVCEE